MIPSLETSTEKKLVGMRLTMSFSNYKVGDLWERFMPRRKEITNRLNDDLISMVVYTSSHFADFKPTNEFDRWATVEVTNFETVPNEMETYVLPGGLYAVFNHKGLSNDPRIFQYIFGAWLPNSKYTLDNRPHFEVLGEKYKNNDPTSEEEIWIPLSEK
jgi:AraC family transcriptional regulator